MKILAIGDVISQIGCEFLRSRLPEFKRKNQIDMVIVNGENSAVGNGILPFSATHLMDSGADVITTGNHVYKRREIYDYIDEHQNVIRPANFPESCPGKGFYVYDMGSVQVCVINILGIVFMENIDCPFKTIDQVLSEIDAKIIIVDMHAEATSEKLAVAHYIDGRATAVFGTHTHVQTADEQLLPKGTAFISDIGMTGPKHSILGIKPECIINRFKTHLPVRFEVSENPCILQGIVLECDEKTGKCIKIERVNLE
jgi:metallophosphoesterase (TIGR00282 family)